MKNQFGHYDPATKCMPYLEILMRCQLDPKNHDMPTTKGYAGIVWNLRGPRRRLLYTGTINQCLIGDPCPQGKAPTTLLSRQKKKSIQNDVDFSLSSYGTKKKKE